MICTRCIPPPVECRPTRSCALGPSLGPSHSRDRPRLSAVAHPSFLAGPRCSGWTTDSPEDLAYKPFHCGQSAEADRGGSSQHE